MPTPRRADVAWRERPLPHGGCRTLVASDIGWQFAWLSVDVCSDVRDHAFRGAARGAVLCGARHAINSGVQLALRKTNARTQERVMPRSGDDVPIPSVIIAFLPFEQCRHPVPGNEKVVGDGPRRPASLGQARGNWP